MANQVDTFIAQYEQELELQEINANKRILNGFIWFLAAVALVWVLSVTDFFKVVMKGRHFKYSFMRDLKPRNLQNYAKTFKRINTTDQNDNQGIIKDECG